tara:strand:- start:3724 stop:5076 length:1353 start_codon:yes stop_codon:yes gene_type:complete
VLRVFSFLFLCISLNVYSDIFLSSPKIKLNAQDQRIIEFKIQNGDIKDGDIFLNEYKTNIPIDQGNIAYTLIEDFGEYQTYKIVLSENYQGDYFSFKILIKDEFNKDVFIFLPTKLRNSYNDEFRTQSIQRIPNKKNDIEQNEIDVNVLNKKENLIIEDVLPEEKISSLEPEIIKADEITTAWSMSKKIKGSNNEISIYQVMWSLYLGNKNAFINENINLIRNDIDLLVPKISEIEEVSYEFAKDSILSMNQSFTENFSTASKSLLVLTAPETIESVQEINEIEIKEEEIKSIAIDEFSSPAEMIDKNTKQISIGLENEIANELLNEIEELQETENKNNFGIFDLIFISIISLASGILLALIFIYLRNIRNAKSIEYDFEEAKDDNSLFSSMPSNLSIENDIDQQAFDLAATYFEMQDIENAKKILMKLVKDSQNEDIKVASINLLKKID